jgi:hypothetical protein
LALKQIIIQNNTINKGEIRKERDLEDNTDRAGEMGKALYDKWSAVFVVDKTEPVK